MNEPIFKSSNAGRRGREEVEASNSDRAYHARLISQEKRFMQRNRKWSLGKFLFLVR